MLCTFVTMSSSFSLCAFWPERGYHALEAACMRYSFHQLIFWKVVIGPSPEVAIVTALLCIPWHSSLGKRMAFSAHAHGFIGAQWGTHIHPLWCHGWLSTEWVIVESALRINSLGGCLTKRNLFLPPMVLRTSLTATDGRLHGTHE